MTSRNADVIVPAPGKWWRHLIINTHASWLHGNPRGFRSRHHRIHSSGDYRNPPPPGEHAALHRYQAARTSGPVVIEPDLREVIGLAFVNALLQAGHPVLDASVGAKHAHAVTELPDNIVAIRAIVGEAKRIASPRSGRTCRARYGRAGASTGESVTITISRTLTTTSSTVRKKGHGRGARRRASASASCSRPDTHGDTRDATNPRRRARKTRVLCRGVRPIWVRSCRPNVPSLPRNQVSAVLRTPSRPPTRRGRARESCERRRRG